MYVLLSMNATQDSVNNLSVSWDADTFFRFFARAIYECEHDLDMLGIQHVQPSYPHKTKNGVPLVYFMLYRCHFYHVVRRY